jgi:hypothetical protein
VDTKVNRSLDFIHVAEITWDRNPKWNLICAWVVEYFGLPGNRYVTEVKEHSMKFNFCNVYDKEIFVLVWGNDGL